ncbi:hypothetical protein PHYBLDRAFT_163217 [Phycomyces blakesleeanus NRRL 1555(-)]|uniref:Uncharacterized protein n=1 Tax=Phycomyces blakesleeanus (strain ATCC 8743b / DSM 1359 / FGSC 10004 / NBRC 33097 / NRRL 1555) TaxID=763407 RepID=A0A162V5P1_PHYB8|nr:hypothetical protein PHYBLDRAFT_163217 [Phycomyces blakesleeanus NRRL 1555(-)]OAD80182.1 hypothetical protein PHYBLDRAFT_163217 [Phycomyces blakesleeanus NRRL 1555(-)]|eukprot:XP_018298222.1 hypothetical protein PHYBLDRAFT_163217 [Phycomyces blakesleeanus NRRL 1555(-)]
MYPNDTWSSYGSVERRLRVVEKILDFMLATSNMIKSYNYDNHAMNRSIYLSRVYIQLCVSQTLWKATSIKLDVLNNVLHTESIVVSIFYSVHEVSGRVDRKYGIPKCWILGENFIEDLIRFEKEVKVLSLRYKIKTDYEIAFEVRNSTTIEIVPKGFIAELQTLVLFEYGRSVIGSVKMIRHRNA